MHNSTITILALLSIINIILISCTKNDPKNVREYSVQSVLWQQNAAEYKALTYQGYALARMQLDIMLADLQNKNSKLAIVTDIDETVLDNIPYNAKLIELNKEFSSGSWYQWGELRQAEAVPGALSFFTYAAAKEVEVFYVSNRNVVQQKATIDNLKKLGFPFADTNHVLLKDSSSAKESRRLRVSKTHKILLLIGDNLSDFSYLFDRQGTQRRNAIVDSLKDAFGTRFIVFPNPIYGDWETKGIYEGKYTWTQQQRDSLRRAKLKSY